jgi:hypothetical protein
LGRSMARMRPLNCSRISEEGGAGGAGAAIARELLRRGGIREDGTETECVRPDVFTKASEPSLGGGHGSGDRMSRGWAALAMTDARPEVQNTHTSLTLYMFCSYHCVRRPARRKKNETRTKTRPMTI